MGEVYRARDTKLDRDVAIKVLPESFALDADRVARFTREAKTLASLNHPNIAAIYGLEESPSTSSGQAGVMALVMELVEGEDLSQKLEGLRAEGSGLPLEEALPIARQIADALEAAHEAGIVHRDLKPANIKVRADGTVKVLDFGLAKMLDGSGKSGGAGRAGGLENSPTLSVHATMQGVILGTAAYMSPEQARGKAVDRRADIWAFGVVLYEMLTGKRAFEGEEISDVLAALLRQEIDTTALPAETPDAIRRLLARCLTRDPKQRLADASTIRLDIDQALKEPAPASTRNSALKMPSDSTGRWLEPNRLLFVEQGKLVARPLDLGRGEFSGGHGAFSISTHGLVAYRPQLADQESHLVWLDRTGAPAGPADRSRRSRLRARDLARRNAAGGRSDDQRQL